MKTAALAARLLLRQRRSAALLLLLAGLIVATAALVTVSLFTDRVARALDRSAGESLAADLVIEARSALPAELRREAEAMGLATAETLVISTVLFSADDSHLVEVKAVSESYPLRGAVRLAAVPGGNDEPAAYGPAPGTGWMEPRALRVLDAAMGDAIELGVHEVRLERVLTYEPDRGNNFFALSPRLMVHLEDLRGSELLGPGARARYRLLVAGPERELQAFRDWAEPRLAVNEELIVAAEADNQTSAVLAQARRFLGMAALTAVILAAVAIVLAAGRFSRGQRDLVALLKAFGASSGQIMLALGVMLLCLAVLAVVAGGLLGLAGQELIARVLAETGPLPPPRLLPLAGSALFVVLLAAGFALPPLLDLRSVTPMRILNRSLDTRLRPHRALWLLPIAAALAIPVLQLGEPRLAAIILGGSAALAAILAVAALLAMTATRALSRHARASWRFGLAGLHRRRGAAVVQVTALGLGLMALLLLMVVRTELMQQWRASLPPDAPDHFAINIQPDQTEALRAELLALGAANLQLRPMANANVVDIRGAAVREEPFTGQVNMSWTDTLPPANQVVEGRFWEPQARGELSLARTWAERNRVAVGDRLTFESGAQRFSATVTNIREVDWNSFNANFFLLLTPEAGERLPHQYIASFHLPPASVAGLRPISQQYPNVSILDVGGLIERVLEIMEQVSRAAQVVFFLTLIAGVVVLLAALESTRDERRGESALIRTLGADNAMVRRGLLIEYGVMACIAALLACGGAAVTGWLLAREMFELAYQPSLTLFALGFFGAALLVIGAGWWGNRSVLFAAPIRILRAG